MTGRAYQDRCLAAALAFAHELGYDSSRAALPQGERNSCDECPLARAVGHFVTSSYVWDDHAIPLPHLVAEFVRMFDRGEYPALVLQRHGRRSHWRTWEHGE